MFHSGTCRFDTGAKKPQIVLTPSGHAPMPKAAKKPCAHPRCGTLIRSGSRCPQHTKQREATRRKARGPRFYDRRVWRDRIRPAKLSRDPLCQDCLEQGRTKPATEVDHIDGDPTNNAPRNLKSLCKPCHTRKTSREQVHRGGASKSLTPPSPTTGAQSEIHGVKFPRPVHARAGGADG